MQLQWKREWTIPSIVGGASFVAGVLAGYGIKSYLSRREYVELEAEVEEREDPKLVQLQFFVEEMADKFAHSVQEADHVVRQFAKDGKDFLEKHAEEMKASMAQPTVEHEHQTNNIFNCENFPWDYSEELKHRSPDRPYILHRDEFFAEEMDCIHSTITYYKGDDVLCDEGDMPIYNPETVVGKLEFGKGSDDPNVVYVRNERLHAEYEVLLDEGFYFVEVLGGDHPDTEIKHSVRKFKDD